MQANRPCCDVEPDEPAITEQETMAELERILSDPEFRSTERNRKFLRYVTEQMLQGRGGKIKAYSIAVDVFGRPADFDPAIDPIVRIEATRLRASLVQYYELHGQEGGLRIDLPRGRYVPAISRLAAADGRVASAVFLLDQNAQAPGTDQRLQSSRLKPSAMSISAAISIGVVGGFLLGAYFLFQMFGPQPKVTFSEKPTVTIDMRSGGDDFDGYGQKMRDTLMVALSQFQTLKVVVAPTSNDVSVDTQLRTTSTAASPQGHYQVVLKHRPGRPTQTVWWQIIDLHSGEAVISRSETVPGGESPSETFVGSLANQIAGVEGIINRIEARRDTANPDLGNRCVLRSYHVLRSLDPAALALARTCLERTLERRPGDADANAALSSVLLAVNPGGEAAELSIRALELANRSVALAPYSASSALAQMSALYRSGRIEPAILAGRRAVSLNPNDGKALAGLGGLLVMIGRWEEGVPLVMKADQIDQTSSHDADVTLAMDAYRRGAFDEALARLWQRHDAPCCDVKVLRTATLGQLGRRQEAEAAAETLRNSRAGFEKSFRADMAARNFEPEFIALLEDGLSKAGLHIQ
jgi:tetratricopeptide (TPR) repeat protein